MNNLKIINLTRTVSTKYGTFGHLDFDGVKLATLEPQRSLIPAGDYLLTFTYSPRFSGKSPYNKFAGVPLVNGVPNHEGIRIHVGNYAADTQGCILVGTYADSTMIYNSRKAYTNMMVRYGQIMHQNKHSFFVLHVFDEYE